MGRARSSSVAWDEACSYFSAAKRSIFDIPACKCTIGVYLAVHILFCSQFSGFGFIWKPGKPLHSSADRVRLAIQSTACAALHIHDLVFSAIVLSIYFFLYFLLSAAALDLLYPTNSWGILPMWWLGSCVFFLLIETSNRASMPESLLIVHLVLPLLRCLGSVL